LCVRKDKFPTTKLADQFTQFFKYTNSWRSDEECINYGYWQALSIPFLLPKACYCDYKTDLNMTKCICSPLESCVALHVEVIDNESRVMLEPISDNNKKSYRNLNVNTHLIVSQLPDREPSQVRQIQLTFKENVEKQYGRTFGEYIGKARLSILDLGLDPHEVMLYDLSVVQATDKELGIDEEWDRIRRWAHTKGP
jgi:hypothetical protein